MSVKFQHVSHRAKRAVADFSLDENFCDLNRIRGLIVIHSVWLDLILEFWNSFNVMLEWWRLWSLKLNLVCHSRITLIEFQNSNMWICELQLALEFNSSHRNFHLVKSSQWHHCSVFKHVETWLKFCIITFLLLRKSKYECVIMASSNFQKIFFCKTQS